jgi:hypothetical protein
MRFSPQEAEMRSRIRTAAATISLAWMLAATAPARSAELKPETLAAFDHYVRQAEQRMDEELGPNTFLLPDAQLPERRDTAYQRLRHGEMIVERLNKGSEETKVPHGLIHHWAGIVFISGATVEQTLALIQDYDHHQDVYSPEVMRSRLVRRQGDTYHIFLCLRKHKVTTVVLESEYDVHFVRLDAHRAYSRSHSTRRVENPGGRSEHERPPANDHG